MKPFIDQSNNSFRGIVYNILLVPIYKKFLVFTNSAPLGVPLQVFVCLSPPHAIFFEDSHWASDHMIRSWPLIG